MFLIEDRMLAVTFDVQERDLICGALALGFAYVELPVLVEGFVELVRGRGRVAGLESALRAKGKLSSRRAEKLERATRLVSTLRDAAVYGTVALNNKLIGEDMLNACMEESRRKGFKASLGEILIERGVIDAKVHKAILERCDQVLDEISAPQTALADVISIEDDSEVLQRKIEILIGEVASKVAFLDRQRLEDYLVDDEKIRKGIPLDSPSEKPAPSAKQAAASAAAEEKQATELQSGSDPIENYQVVKKLGAGAMGAVYRAVKKDSRETVALKVLKPDLSNDHEFVQRFLREAKAVARLNHPNVIRAVDVGKSGKFYYFAMEFVDGQTVSEILKREKTLPERACLKIVKQIALALDHAWKHKLIHRDVKPDNIMVMKNGQAKLTDLGLARSARDSTLTMTGVVMGSPAYISPEQATGEKNLDTRSDIYSLGATIYHMLTGVVPYEGDSPLQVMLRHMNDPLPDVRTRVPTVSEGTRQLIFKMMAKRPESRFQNARQLYDAILSTEKLLAGSSVEELSRSQAAMRRGLGANVPASGALKGLATTIAPPSSDSQKMAAEPGASEDAKASGEAASGKTKSGVAKGKAGGKTPSEKSPAGKDANELRDRMKKLKKRRI